MNTSRLEIARQNLSAFGVNDLDQHSNGKYYATCPGQRFHTSPNAVSDFVVNLDGAPTAYCFHDSCRPQVDAFNTVLRSSISRAELNGNQTSYAPSQPVKAMIENVEPEEIPASTERAESDARKYIVALFQPGDLVAYNTSARHDPEKDKWTPAGNGTVKTAKNIVDCLDRLTVAESLEGLNEQAGAWCRLNPVDGKGIADANVTTFNHALVESDCMPIEMQLAFLKKLHLPLRFIIHSGGKSLHGVAKIEAGTDRALFDERVELLYDFLEKSGFKVDRKNKNPSRLSRMPGVMRNGKMQYIVAENTGAKSWEAWQDWCLSKEDGCAQITSQADMVTHKPERNPEIICGVLRRRNKMIISASPKAGKSFLVTRLAHAIATGGEWLGFPCVKGRVLQVDFEIDASEQAYRVEKVVESLGGPSENADLLMLNTMPHGLGDKVPLILRRMKGRGYSAVIVDPIYMMFDEVEENSNTDMAKFMRGLGRICTEGNAALICVHHFSKGQQGAKKSMDRASGAGVLARNPEAIFTMTEIEGVEEDPRGIPFKVEMTLRYFKNPPAKNVWFRYPHHMPDTQGDLSAAKPLGAPGRKSKQPPGGIRIALDTFLQDGRTDATTAEVVDRYNLLNPESEAGVDSIRRWGKELDKASGWTYERGIFIAVSNQENE